MRGIFAASLQDAKDLFTRRFHLGLALTVIALVVGISSAVLSGNVVFTSWLISLSFWVLCFSYYADAMRRVLVPDYRLNPSNVLRVFLVLCIVSALAIAGSLFIGVPSYLIPMNQNSHHVLTRVALFFFLTYFSAKLAFTIFLLDDRGVFDAYSYSWSLTSGAAFWPTVFVMAIYWTVVVIGRAGMTIAYAALAPRDWVALDVLWSYVFVGLLGAFLYPLFARWMIECEAVARQREAADGV